MKLTWAKRFFLFVLVWLVLSAGDPSGWIVGVFAALGATWLSVALLPPGGNQINLLAFLKLAPRFVVHSFSGGIDVAWRALHPRMPLNVGWLVYRTALPTSLQKIWLGSETTLFPGSLVAGRRGNLLYVHCLDKGQDIIGQMREEEGRIAASLRERKGKPPPA